MGRKPLIDREQLMSAAEKLLMADGYQGFTFKKLAESLGIARSTLYEYYANKDELIVSYMLTAMEEVLVHVTEIQRHASITIKIKKLLRLFRQYKQIPQLIQTLPFIEENKSPDIQTSLNRLWSHHEQLYDMVDAMMNEGKKEGKIRSEIQNKVIISYLFSSVLMPNPGHLDADELAEQLSEIILHGIAVQTDAVLTDNHRSKQTDI